MVGNSALTVTKSEIWNLPHNRLRTISSLSVVREGILINLRASVAQESAYQKKGGTMITTNQNLKRAFLATVLLLVWAFYGLMLAITYSDF